MLEAIRNDLAEEFREEDVLIQTAYSGSPEKGAIWNQIVQDAFPEKHVENFVLPLSIACHTEMCIRDRSEALSLLEHQLQSL